MDKALMLGTFCDSADEPLLSTMPNYSKQVHDLRGDPLVFDGPQFYRCNGLYTHTSSDIAISFTDGSGQDVDSWVKFDINNSGKGEIIVEPTSATMYNYKSSWVTLHVIG